MTLKTEVRSWSPADAWAEYDLAYAVLGYETRARYAMEVLSPAAAVRVAWGFGSQEELAFEENRKWFTSSGFECTVVTEKDHERAFADVLTTTLREHKREVHVVVDISSITRARMAHIVWSLARFSSRRAICVDFVYSLAHFQSPPKRHTRNSVAGPVSSWFAGWWSEPERPLAAVVGLGYEEDKALGIVEHLQAPEVWTLVPRSIEAEYDVALDLANRRLIDLVPNGRRLRYHVEQPFQTFLALESLVDGLSQGRNTVLIPFGPKIFTIISLIVALRHREIPVWRVSGGVLQTARDAKPSGPIYGLRVSFASEEADAVR